MLDFLRSIIPGGLICFFKDHRWTLAQVIGTRLTVRWCPVCNRVDWID